jgi:hypothetical protein
VTSIITELFTYPTSQEQNWAELVAVQQCAYLARRCIKVRKSTPEISIRTCSVRHGSRHNRPMIICPHRYLERGQIFLDSLHLLRLHEPGNELHCIPEIDIPGGSVDYFLVSVRDGKVIDFVGIELQAVDTTGSLWHLRQQFLHTAGIIEYDDVPPAQAYGINWKMTAKTTLVQLHHKVETFEQLGKHLVLVLQDDLLNYMRREFMFDHIQGAHLGDAMHFHAYTLAEDERAYRVALASRSSTNAAGVAASLGLQTSANVELDIILNQLRGKISSRTTLRL